MKPESLSEIFDDMERRVAASQKAADRHYVKMSDLRHGDYFIYAHPVAEVPVFGEVIEKTYSEEGDAQVVRGRGYGFIYARSFSVLCPEGELGDVHLTQIRCKISAEMFGIVKANNFKLPEDN